MRLSWALGSPTSLPAPLVFERVLLEYDGPLVALFRCGEFRWIGEAADDVNDAVRWVLAPIGTSDEPALAQVEVGRTPLRDLFEVPYFLVVDYVDEEPTRIWVVKREDIPEETLPLAEARLGCWPR